MKDHTKLFLSIILIFCFLLFENCVTPNTNVGVVSKQIDTTKPLEILAFGSCNKSDLPQDYWQNIGKTNPDLWVWLGDMIYADTENMDKLKTIYDGQKTNAFYADFATKTPIIGMWDDHDYGENDGGKTYTKKQESQQIALDFLDVPKDAEVRKREGLYQSYTFGEKGKTVKIILLDSRYFRDELQKNTSGYARYLINKTGDILGETQWQWLENELVNSKAEINIIGSSIQIIPEEQGFEKWANFPVARQRFLDLIAKTQPKNPIIISGDRHIAEISKIKLDSFETPIYEITSSGLTHAYTKPEAKNEKNKYRFGELINEKNFAILKIDWQTGMVVAEIHSTEGGVLLRFKLEMKD
jgi:alkaline phosphatase D